MRKAEMLINSLRSDPVLSEAGSKTSDFAAALFVPAIDPPRRHDLLMLPAVWGFGERIIKEDIAGTCNLCTRQLATE